MSVRSGSGLRAHRDLRVPSAWSASLAVVLPASRLAAIAVAVLGLLAGVAIGTGGWNASADTSPPVTVLTTMTSPYGIVPTTTATTPTVTTPTTKTTTTRTTKTTPTKTTPTKTTPTKTTPTKTTPTKTTKTTPTAPPPVISAGPAGNPFATRGMWIWVLASSDHGNVRSIVAQAKAAGIKTLLIKSSDGTQLWSQFNRSTVAALHAGGLHVCAWQFVYGIHPAQEARDGADAVKAGANCLVIDAESQYQGKYVQAQMYIRTLRKLIGERFPVALAGLPYVDDHPAFPYSVFLGPSGAQVNTPQMYWRDIGTSVAAVYAHTYEFNLLYERPIDPLGQLFEGPPAAQIRQFRAAATAYGGAGVSWWDWQSATSADWTAIAQPLGPLRGFAVQRTAVSIGRGAEGDVVVWAQEHLVSAGSAIGIDGIFGPQTQGAVKRFQSRHGILATGVITPATWTALLRFKPAAVTWVQHGGGQTAARASGDVVSVPASAALPAKRDELPDSPGQGYPKRR
jgi:hypothetical protein